MERKRKVVGRPRVAPHLKKEKFTTRLPLWLINWLAEQETPTTQLIEKALCEQHDICAPVIDDSDELPKVKQNDLFEKWR